MPLRCSLSTRSVKEGSSFLDVLRISRRVGLASCQHDQRTVAEGLRIPRLIRADLRIARSSASNHDRPGRRRRR